MLNFTNSGTLLDLSNADFDEYGVPLMIVLGCLLAIPCCGNRTVQSCDSINSSTYVQKYIAQHDSKTSQHFMQKYTTIIR